MAGGHLVHAQYMRLISAIPGLEVRLYLTPRSLDVHQSPWSEFANLVEPNWEPEKADILFVAGLDWLAHSREQSLETQKPFINLIQGLRHGDPDNPRYTFLDRKALRICVGPEIEEAIVATRLCNGPVVTITNALAPSLLSRRPEPKTIKIAIAAAKKPAMAALVSESLMQLGFEVDLIPAIDRASFLSRLERAEIAVLLPDEREGFYLPALEAMALGCLVICPDCVGNRSFCMNNVNSLKPAGYTALELLNSALGALVMPVEVKNIMLASARITALAHNEKKMNEQLTIVITKALYDDH